MEILCIIHIHCSSMIPGIIPQCIVSLSYNHLESNHSQSPTHHIFTYHAPYKINQLPPQIKHGNKKQNRILPPRRQPPAHNHETPQRTPILLPLLRRMRRCRPSHLPSPTPYSGNSQCGIVHEQSVVCTESGVYGIYGEGGSDS